MRYIYNIIGIVTFALMACSQVMAADARTTAEACWSEGIAAYEAKDYRAAIVDYDRALELDPNLAEAYYNRGLTHIFLGNNRQGVQDLSKAGELGLYSAYNIIKRFTERNE